MAKNVIVVSGSISKWNVSRDYVDYYLRQAGSGPVTVQIHSLGGDVDEAIAISNLFAEHGNVTAEFVGFNASAATFMAYGAKEILIHEDTFMLVHNCSISVDIYGMLQADKIEEKIAELKKAKKQAEAINLVIAKKYFDRCGQKKELKDVFQLMNESRWMPADEIIEWNFADKVLPGINKPGTVSNQVSNDLQAHGFKLPENLVITPQNDKSILDKMEDLFSKMLKPYLHTDNSLSNNNINTEPKMNKEFIAVCTLLAVEALAENDGKITLTVDQLKTINAKIDSLGADLNKALNDVKTASDTATADMALLDAISPKVAEVDGMAAKCSVIKKVIDSIPNSTETHKPANDGSVDFSDIATDEINSYGIND